MFTESESLTSKAKTIITTFSVFPLFSRRDSLREFSSPLLNLRFFGKTLVFFKKKVLFERYIFFLVINENLDILQ